MAANKAKSKVEKTLEQSLWGAADALRGNQERGEYKHVVLGLFLLKYISDRFQDRRKAIETSLADTKSAAYWLSTTTHQIWSPRPSNLSSNKPSFT